MKVTTESGSVYEIDGLLVRRVSDHPLRRDGEWLTLQEPPTVPMRQSMRLWLEPLGEGGCTCPSLVYDGAGVPLFDGPVFWVTAGCPLHDPQPDRRDDGSE